MCILNLEIEKDNLKEFHFKEFVVGGTEMKRWLHYIYRKAIVEVWTVQWKNRLSLLKRVSMSWAFKIANWIKEEIFENVIKLYLHKYGDKCLYYVRL